MLMMQHGEPAKGMLGILPISGNGAATIDDVRWLADVLAFDHNAPVGIAPAWTADGAPIDPAAVPASQPIHPFEGAWTRWHWDSQNQAYAATADLRFNGSYVLRYRGDDESPSTDFSMRFDGKRELIALYAMAARQPDVLAEFLCLYRIFEAADGENGKRFSASKLPVLGDKDYGDLRVVGNDACFDDAPLESVPNAFDVYRERAQHELERLAANGVDDVPSHLYGIRNSLAHGKQDVLTAGCVDRFAEAARALPAVKLLARLAIEP